MIKSARVMKKAVGYLIPFMESEREANNKLLAEQGLKVDDQVSHENSYEFGCCSLLCSYFLDFIQTSLVPVCFFCFSY